MDYTMQEVHALIGPVVEMNFEDIRHCVIIAQSYDGRIKFLSCNHSVDLMVTAIAEKIVCEDESGN